MEVRTGLKLLLELQLGEVDWVVECQFALSTFFKRALCYYPQILEREIAEREKSLVWKLETNTTTSEKRLQAYIEPHSRFAKLFL